MFSCLATATTETPKRDTVLKHELFDGCTDLNKNMHGVSSPRISKFRLSVDSAGTSDNAIIGLVK